MQVANQEFGIRLMSCASKIFAGSKISLSKDIIPPPVYATGFCMCGGNELAKGPVRMSSSDLDVNPNHGKFTEIACCNVFLGNCIKILKNDKRNDIDGKLKTAQNELKTKVVKFFEGNQLPSAQPIHVKFKALSLQEKEVYLWLEFLAFAHLMTKAQKNLSLTCLGAGQMATKAIFDAVYNAIKFNFEGKNMKKIKADYPDLWGC
jgi:hypothetical protein